MTPPRVTLLLFYFPSHSQILLVCGWLFCQQLNAGSKIILACTTNLITGMQSFRTKITLIQLLHKLGVDVLHKCFTTHSTTWLFAAVYVSPHQPQTLIDWTILSLSLHLPLSIVFMQGFVIPRKILDQGPHVKNSMGIPPGIYQEIEDKMS